MKNDSSYITDLTAAHARIRDLEMRELIGHQEYLKIKERAEKAEHRAERAEHMLAGYMAESTDPIAAIAGFHRDAYAGRTHDDNMEPLCPESR
jgi:hypothetical protein